MISQETERLASASARVATATYESAADCDCRACIKDSIITELLKAKFCSVTFPNLGALKAREATGKVIRITCILLSKDIAVETLPDMGIILFEAT